MSEFGDAGSYVAAAYLVFLALVLIYVAIMASKLARLQRDIGELSELAERRDAERAGDAEPHAGAGGVAASAGEHEPSGVSP